MAYGWDAAGRLIAVDGAANMQIAYDALGFMAEQNGSLAEGPREFIPDLLGGGRSLAGYIGQSPTAAWIPLPGGAVAQYYGGSLAWHQHAGWLGSARLFSTPSRQIFWDGGIAPYGEPYAQSGSAASPESTFTGAFLTTEWLAPDLLYDFPYRRLSSVEGRWLSPDPAGLAAVDPADPQTWNAYAYVANQPLSATDPLGLLEPPCGFSGCGGGLGGPGPCDASLYGWDPWPAPGCGGMGWPPTLYPAPGGWGGGWIHCRAAANRERHHWSRCRRHHRRCWPAPASAVPAPPRLPDPAPRRCARRSARWAPAPRPQPPLAPFLQSLLAACAGNPICEIAVGGKGAGPANFTKKPPAKAPAAAQRGGKPEYSHSYLAQLACEFGHVTDDVEVAGVVTVAAVVSGSDAFLPAAALFDIGGAWAIRERCVKAVYGPGAWLQ